MDHKLVYQSNRDDEELFTTYSDADHGSNKDNRGSTGRYVTCTSSGAVDWQSWLQLFIALSVRKNKNNDNKSMMGGYNQMRSILHPALTFYTNVSI